MKISSLILLILTIVSCAHDSKKVVIAHRGASGYLPEHTLEASAMAHGFGVDFIEPDLVLTKDNQLVVLHDIHIDSTTNVDKVFPKRSRKDGRYYAIDFTLQELKKLNVTERKNYKNNIAVFKNRFPLKSNIDFKIPSFREFLELIKGLNKSRGVDIGIYPEIKKPEFHLAEKKDITLETYKILKEYGYDSKDAKVFVQCFYPPTLKRLKEKLKANLKLVQLIAENSWSESSVNYDQLQTKQGLKEISTYAQGVGPYYKQLIKVQDGEIQHTNFVRWAHAYGLEVHTYTHRSDALPNEVNSDKKFLKLLLTDLNVDGVFSDFPDKVLKHISR